MSCQASCSGLNEKGLHRFTYFERLVSRGGRFGEGLGFVALLEGLCFEVLKSTPFPVSVLCLLLMDEDVSSQRLPQQPSLLTTTTLAAIIVMDSSPQKLSPQVKFILINCLGYVLLPQ